MAEGGWGRLWDLVWVAEGGAVQDGGWQHGVDWPAREGMQDG